MRHFWIAGTLAMSAMTAVTTSLSAAEVGVSLSIGQPGFYGQLDIGGYPPPPLIYRQPMIVERAPANRPPIYLRVPPGHAKHWSQHCREYNACSERVYFVQDNWYQREYAPRYRERGGERVGEHHDEHDRRHKGDDRGRDGRDR